MSVKGLTVTEESVNDIKFTFNETAHLYMSTCVAPVVTESGLWRKLKTNEPS